MDASDSDCGLIREPAGAFSSFVLQPSEKSAMPDGSPAKRRILVVEDEMLIGMLLEDMLTDMGYQVVAIVPRLKEALAAVERDNPRHVVFDGLAVLRLLSGDSLRYRRQLLALTRPQQLVG